MQRIKEEKPLEQTTQGTKGWREREREKLKVQSSSLVLVVWSSENNKSEEMK